MTIEEIRTIAHELNDKPPFAQTMRDALEEKMYQHMLTIKAEYPDVVFSIENNRLTYTT